MGGGGGGHELALATEKREGGAGGHKLAMGTGGVEGNNTFNTIQDVFSLHFTIIGGLHILLHLYGACPTLKDDRYPCIVPKLRVEHGQKRHQHGLRQELYTFTATSTTVICTTAALSVCL